MAALAAIEPRLIKFLCERSSMVEHFLAKEDVVGSNPIARSN